MSKKPNTVKNIKTDAAKPFILFSFDGAVMYTEPAILATYRHVFEKLGNGMELQPQNEQEILRSSEKEVFEKYLPEVDTMKALEMYNEKSAEVSCGFIRGRNRHYFLPSY